MESNINENEINDYILNYINNKMEEYQNNILILPSLNHSKNKKLSRKTWDKYIKLNTKKSKHFTIEI